MDYSKDSNDHRRKDASSKTKKARNRIIVIAFRAIIAIVLISIFAVGGIAIGAYMGIIDSVAHLDNMSYAPVGEVSVIYDMHGNEIGRFMDTNRESVTIDDMPKHLQNAMVAIEDQRFFEHNGVDIRGTLRAIFVTLTTNRSEGGSTITQQLIKNNVMNLNANTVETKLQEQFLALRLTSTLTETMGRDAAKLYILEQYLNTIYLANGVNGVQAAARFYFGKDVSELTLSESAVIVGITQRPSFFNPITNPENSRERQVTVLNRMLAQGFITEREHREALDDPVYDRISTFRIEQGGREFQGYFIDYLFEVLVNELIDKNIVFTRADATNLIFNGGLSIYTTMDPNIQNILEEASMDDSLFPSQFEVNIEYRLSMRDTRTDETTHHNFVGNNVGVVYNKDAVDAWVEEKRAELLGEFGEVIQESIIATPQPQTAMIVIDHSTGQVRGILGGRGEVQTNLALNRATATPRQPGSVFKMIAAYAPAFDLGIAAPGSVREDKPVTFPQWGGWSPRNFNPNQFSGRVNLRTAIANSINTIPAQLMEEIGIDRAFDYMQNFGISTLIDEPVNGRTDRVPSVVLGGLTQGVTQIDITAAFASMANAGLYIEPSVYTKVLDHNNQVLIEATPDVRQVIRPSTAYLLTSSMEDVITRGTGGRARLSGGMAQAGKTGTSQNTHDISFVGYTPYYTAGIWMGFDQPRTLVNHNSIHLTFWAHVMNKIHEDLPVISHFERPSTVVSREISIDSGLLAVPGVSSRIAGGSRVRTDFFDVDHIPTEFDPNHREMRIDTQTGRPVTGDTPLDQQELIPVVIDPETGLPTDESYESIREQFPDVSTVEPPEEGYPEEGEIPDDNYVGMGTTSTPDQNTGGVTVPPPTNNVPVAPPVIPEPQPEPEPEPVVLPSVPEFNEEQFNNYPLMPS